MTQEQPMTNQELMEQALAEGVRHAREQAGVTQEELARRLDRFGYKWHQSTINKIETRDRKLTAGEGIHIAQALDIPFDWLVYGDPNSLVNQIRQLQSYAHAFVGDMGLVEETLEKAVRRQDRVAQLLAEVEERLKTEDPEVVKTIEREPVTQQTLALARHIKTAKLYVQWLMELRDRQGKSNTARDARTKARLG